MGVGAAGLSRIGDIAGLVDDDGPKEAYRRACEWQKRVDPFSVSSWIER